MKTVVWPSIDPGKLRHQITIYRQVAATDASGVTVGWEVFLNTYAAIEPWKATDIMRSGQTISELTLPIHIMYQAGILPNMEVQALNGRYIIQDILNPLELNVSLTLMCLAFGANQ